MVIYKFTNLINGKVYIGKSITPSKRYTRHLSESRRGSKFPIHEAIRKYGIENFKYEIIDGANSASELNYKEIHHIHSNSCLSPNGYNLELGKKKNISSVTKHSKSLKSNTSNTERLHEIRVKSLKKISKKVVAINQESYERIVFDSVKACERHFELGENRIAYMLRGESSYRAILGYLFEYLDHSTVKSSKRKYNQQIGQR